MKRFQLVCVTRSRPDDADKTEIRNRRGQTNVNASNQSDAKTSLCRELYVRSREKNKKQSANDHIRNPHVSLLMFRTNREKKKTEGGATTQSVQRLCVRRDVSRLHELNFVFAYCVAILLARDMQLCHAIAVVKPTLSQSALFLSKPSPAAEP